MWMGGGCSWVLWGPCWCYTGYGLATRVCQLGCHEGEFGLIEGKSGLIESKFGLSESKSGLIESKFGRIESGFRIKSYCTKA